MSPVRTPRLHCTGACLGLLLLLRSFCAVPAHAVTATSLIALRCSRAVAAFLLLLLEELVTGHAAL